MYNPVLPIDGTKFFNAFETLTEDQSRQALLDAWSTPDQQLYNLLHKPCSTCNGQGYRKIKTGHGRDTKIEREHFGCPTCKGTGAVLK